MLQGVIGAVGVQLSDEEIARLAAIPAEVSNLIYAGQLCSFVLEFAGEACEVVLEYYPQEEEHDDLDLSLLEAVDWGDVDALTLVARQVVLTSLVGSCSNVHTEELWVAVSQAVDSESVLVEDRDRGFDLLAIQILVGPGDPDVKRAADILDGVHLRRCQITPQMLLAAALLWKVEWGYHAKLPRGDGIRP